MKRHRSVLLLFAAALGLVVAMLGAASALEWVRPVEVATIFAGAFGSGAALVEALHTYRANA